MNDTIDNCRVAGTITLDGEDIYTSGIDAVELRARVGMVFQNPNPFPKSIYENVAYGPRIHGLARHRSEFDEIVETSLIKAGLFSEVKDRLHEPGTSLSGGQQQRLCIARTIAVSPEVILMDEPCSALDPIATARVEELISDLRQNFTIVHGHALHAAGRPCFGAHGNVPSRPYGRGKRYGYDFHEPDRPAYPGLHHGSLRLRRRGGFRTLKHEREQPWPTSHILTAFDDELKYLQRRISEMGGLAEEMVSESVTALVNTDTALAQKVISDDLILDEAEREIGDKAVVVIARRQPVATDLREIVGAIRIAADLERVGDMAKNTAKRVISVQGTGVPRKLAHGIEHLSELALLQLKEVLDAYNSRQADKANSIRERDDEIDAIYTSLFRELLTYMMEDPRNITTCTHLLFCAKNIERIGDPRHQYCGDDLLHRNRRTASGGTSQGRYLDSCRR